MITQRLGQNLRAEQLVNRTHAPAADTAAVITLAAKANVRHVVAELYGNYSETPTGGGITVTSNAVSIFSVAFSDLDKYITMPIIGNVGEAVVITLAAGAGTCVGKINAVTTELP